MRIQISRASVLVLAVALCLSSALQVSGQDRDDEAVIGSWEGTLTVAAGAQLTVVFNVERSADGGLTGTMESPDQGATGIPISSATFDDGTLTLVASSVPGNPTFTGTPSEDGNMLSGTLSQAGSEFPLELTKREASSVQAQDVRTVEVDGHRMRVSTSGIENAEPGAPVVVFEAGGGGGLAAWGFVVQDVANFAAVVAYDRAGMQGSESDGELPTPRHVAENLHALLEQLGAAPPYVLVGHSLGGPYIRMFTGMYPEDVGGLVYVDPTNIVTEEDQRALDEAMGLPPGGYQRLIESRLESVADAQVPAGVLAESEVIMELLDTHFAEFHSLPPVPDVPVTVLMASRFDPSQWVMMSRDVQLSCEPRECHARTMQVRMEMLSAVAHEVTRGTLTLVTNSGHFIQTDDPDLVVSAIRRVVDASVVEPTPERIAVELSLALLEAYVGVYEAAPQAQFTVTLEGGQLFVQLTGQPAFPVFPEAEDEFFVTLVDAQISFVRDSAGEVTQLILHQMGRNIPARRVP